TQRIESAPRAVASAAPQETTLATARRSDYTGGNRDDETELQNSQSICFRDDGCVSARPGNYHQCKRQRVQRRRQAYRDPLWREEDKDSLSRIGQFRRQIDPPGGCERIQTRGLFESGFRLASGIGLRIRFRDAKRLQ